MNLIFDVAIVNAPMFLLLIFAMAYVRNIPKYKMLYLGLFIVFLSGIVSIPYSNWLFENHSDLIQNELIFLSISTLPIGLFHMIGLLLCIVAFVKK